MITATIENVLVKGHPKERVVVVFSKYEFGFGRGDKPSPEQVLEIASKVYPFPTIISKSKVKNIHDGDTGRKSKE